MRTLLRGFLIALLIVALTEAPLGAGVSRPLGVVVEAQRSWLGSSTAEGGATVFGGETLATDSAGSLRVRAGAAQLYLLPESAATLREAAAGVGVSLQHGTLVFSSSVRDTIEVHASQLVIRPRAGEPAYGKVTLNGLKELEIASYRGVLEVSLGNETRSVAANSAYRVVLEPEPQGPKGSGVPQKAGHAGWVWFAIGAIAVGTAIALWRATISPDHP